MTNWYQDLFNTDISKYVYYSEPDILILHGDCLEILPSMKEERVDLVLTDPPYFLPATHYQTRKQFSRNFSDLGILEHFIKDIFRELNRVTKNDGVIYVFCDGQSYPLFYYHLYPFCKSVRPLIWDKKTSINGYSWRHQHEIIIFAEKPQTKPVPSGDGDILRFSAVKVDNRIHPAEKPVELLEAFINKSTKENDFILDPFLGSGTTLVACKQLGRKGIGIEIEEKYCAIAKERLKQEVLKL